MGVWQFPIKKFKRGPVFGVVDSWHPNGHRGTDLNGFKEGTPTVAPQDGKFVVNKWSDGLGNCVVLEVEATWKGEPKKIYFGFAHGSKPSPLKVGTKVNAGDTILAAGTTGKFSSGTHCHYTLSLTKDGLFAGKVYDAHAYIARRIKEQETPNA